MSRDPSLRKRNALVIPGGILLFYCAVAILYAEGFRRKSDFCPDGSWILIDHVCYTVWKILLPLVLLAVGLIVAGVSLRGSLPTREDRLKHGTPGQFMLALLASLVIVPLAILIIQLYRQQALDTTFVLEYYDVPFKHTFLLTLALLTALAVFLPYLGAYVAADLRRRDYLATAEMQPDTHVHDEDDGFEEPEQDWPDGRDDEPLTQTGQYKIRARPVDDVEGIGIEYAGRLRDAGIRTTSELVAQDPATLAPIIDVTAKEMVAWQQMAELMGVSGIGPQYAEALARSGISGIDDLKRLHEDAIVAQVKKYLEGHPRLTRGNITAGRVKKWKETAAWMEKA